MAKIKSLIKNSKFQTTVFYIILFILCFAISTKNDSIDVDMWSRLIMGQHVFQTGTVMKTDIVSYTPTHVWYDHEWLSSTFFYIVIKFFGATGLNILKTILSFLIILTINFVIEQNQNTRDYKYKFVYLLAITALFSHIAVFGALRCQHFTYILLPLFIYLLERSRMNPSSKTIWFIPLIMLFWLNCHGGAVAGYGIILLYAIGELISRRPCKQYFLVLIPSTLVWLINPWGFDFIPFMINASTLKRQWIGEWQSPFTMVPSEIVFFVITVVIFAFVYIYSNIRNKVKLKDIHYPKLIVLLILTYMAFGCIKHCFLYYIGALAYQYEDFKVLLDDIHNQIKKIIKIEFVIYPLFLLIGLIYSIYVFCNYSISENYYEKTSETMPFRALQFIRDNDLKGKIFAPYYVSGYIARREYPNLKIHIDGRQEQVWKQSTFKKHMEFLFYTYNGAEKVLEKYKPDIILLENAWYANMWFQKKQNYYKKVYDDGKFTVYLDPKVKKFNYKMPAGAPEYTIYNLFDTNLDFKKTK